MLKKVWDIGIRVQCLTLLQYKVYVDDVVEWLGLSRSSILRWLCIAKERGFDAELTSWILAQYVTDASRSGRPTVLTDAVQKLILQTISKNSIIY